MPMFGVLARGCDVILIFGKHDQLTRVKISSMIISNLNWIFCMFCEEDLIWIMVVEACNS